MMSALALRATPSTGSLLINQGRLLLIRNKWELLFMGMVTFIYHLGTLTESVSPLIFRGVSLFNNDSLGFAIHWIYLLFGAFWAFKIWEGHHTGHRFVFFSYPANRTIHQFFRITAGAVVFFAVITFFWLLGATVAEIIKPGYSWFTASEYGGSGWLVTLFGVLNAYLYATILALLFRKPEFWFLIWIPVTVSLFMYVIGRTGIDWLTDALKGILGWPFGVLAGFGLSQARHSIEPYMGIPNLGTVLMWTLIIAIGVFLVARIHRGD